MRGLRMGLGFTNVGATGGAGGGSSWTPASTTLAAWYDISDISTLFQDTAGTVPVTADGQVVKRINDKSSSGLHLKAHFNTGYPYRANSGKPYIEVHADDYWEADTAVVMTNTSGEWSVVMLYQFPTTLSGTTFNTNTMSSQFFGSNGTSPLARAFDASGSSFVSDIYAIAVPTSPTVWMGITSSSQHELFIGNSSDGPTAVTGTLFSGPQKPAFMLTGASTADQRFYGLWVSKGAYDSATRGNAQTYGAAKLA